MMNKALAGDPGRKRKVLGRTPMGRFGEAADIGWAAVYLCSPAAKYITELSFPLMVAPASDFRQGSLR